MTHKYTHKYSMTAEQWRQWQQKVKTIIVSHGHVTVSRNGSLRRAFGLTPEERDHATDGTAAVIVTNCAKSKRIRLDWRVARWNGWVMTAMVATDEGFIRRVSGRLARASLLTQSLPTPNGGSVTVTKLAVTGRR